MIGSAPAPGGLTGSLAFDALGVGGFGSCGGSADAAGLIGAIGGAESPPLLAPTELTGEGLGRVCSGGGFCAGVESPRGG